MWTVGKTQTSNLLCGEADRWGNTVQHQSPVRSSKPEKTLVGGIKTKMELVSKPSATAASWEHFGFKPNGRGEPLNLYKPICR